MFSNISNISNIFYTDQYSLNNLSDSGQKSISRNIVNKFYEMVIDHYKIIDSSLTVKRDISSGTRLGINRDKLYVAPRLKYELTCLVTTLLKNLEKFDLEKLINQDSELTDEDKVILKKAYDSLKNNIKTLYQIFGEPCFGREKIEEENENVN